MVGVYTIDKSIILPKEISEVSYSNKVDYATFAGVLNDTVVSYKMYWLLINGLEFGREIHIFFCLL